MRSGGIVELFEGFVLKTKSWVLKNWGQLAFWGAFVYFEVSEEVKRAVWGSLFGVSELE